MNYKQMLEETEQAVARLQQLNKEMPILVEGEKDVHALRQLGMTGEILTVHAGCNLVDFCDGVARRYEAVVILTDWDKQGGRLSAVIRKNLGGRTRCLTEFRALFARSSMVKDVEGLPSFLHSMRQKVGHPRPWER
ncbi:MAG TPA: hypothetical protein ENN54_05675 [Thermoplasmatales archaeon]|nr:hypothetical protein [Thermoplasmatales archaeon]